jgi:2,4-dienoyl-CoA reductase-like NADH-dependent reductase (Old Yellow Enzyme family)
MTSTLFMPARMGNLEVKNRLVRSATSERLAGKEGPVTDELVAFYDRLAKGGVGTIISGHAFVAPEGRANPLMMGFHSNDMIRPAARLAKAVRNYDTAMFVQLSHAGIFGRTKPLGIPPAGPSAIPPEPGQPPARAMSTEEVYRLANSFADAASRVREAGFSGVQIHAAHGYLVSQFLSPDFNKRIDEFGGSIDNRARLLVETLRRIRQKTDSTFPVIVKMNCSDFTQLGLTVDESAGVTAIEISGGLQFEDVIKPGVISPGGEAYFLKQATEIRAAVKVPLMLVGGMRSPEVMEMTVVGEKFDFVSASRPFIRQPDMPGLLMRGKKASCISCNKCLGRKKGGLVCALDENKGSPE